MRYFGYAHLHCPAPDRDRVGAAGTAGLDHACDRQACGPGGALAGSAANRRPPAHLLLALKHEGLTCPSWDRSCVPCRRRARHPRAHLRIAGCLCEALNDRRLEDLSSFQGSTVDLFDPKGYISGPSVRDVLKGYTKKVPPR